MSPRTTAHKAPFPYFGGKSAVSGEVWSRFGSVGRYIEPFCGSLAVMLNRPLPFVGREIVNDADGLLVNVWRAMAADPDAVARWADWPATENDLHARHAWLVGKREDITRRLEGDPEWFDAKAAGWWLYGIALWIGGGWCSGTGPWRVVDGQLLHAGNDGQGVNRQLLHAGDDGRGVNRKLLHAGDGQGVNRQLLHAGDGQGVNRKRLHAGNDGQGVNRQLLHAGNDGQEATTAEASTGSADGVSRRALPHTGNSPMHGVHSDALRRDLAATFTTLADRLRGTMIMCGDWKRVVTPAVLFSGGNGATGVFLDPPYADTAGRTSDLYAKDSDSVAHAVREWAIANGDDPRLRIALCGYEGEHVMPDSWYALAWKAAGGYEGQAKGGRTGNSKRERIWFSPHCERPGLWEATA